jgi:hypothetical protein
VTATSGLGRTARPSPSMPFTATTDDRRAGPLDGRSPESKIRLSRSTQAPAGAGSEGSGGVRPGAVEPLEDAPAVRRLRRSRELGRRERRVTARFHGPALAGVEEAARAAGLTVAAFVAEAAVRAARGMPGPRALPAERRAQLASLRAVNRVYGEARAQGTNLNQIAKVANTTGMVPRDLADALARHEALEAELRAVILRLVGDGDQR